MQTVHSHNNFFVFTGALVFLLLVSSLVASTSGGEHHLVLQGVIFCVQLLAYFSLNLSRAWRIFVVAMVILMLAGNVMRELSDLSVTPFVSLTAHLLFFCGMAWAAARQALFTGRIEANTIAGTFAVYMLLGLIWTVLYLLCLEVWPEAFSGVTYRDFNDNFGVMVYYSYVTMTTLGYGDINPIAPVARALASLQALTGTFYMAVVVASIIGSLSRTKN